MTDSAVFCLLVAGQFYRHGRIKLYLCLHLPVTDAFSKYRLSIAGESMSSIAWCDVMNVICACAALAAGSRRCRMQIAAISFTSNRFVLQLTAIEPSAGFFKKIRLAEPYFRLISGLAEFLRKLRNSAEHIARTPQIRPTRQTNWDNQIQNISSTTKEFEVLRHAHESFTEKT